MATPWRRRAGSTGGQAFEAWRGDYAALGYYDRFASSNATAEQDAFDLACLILPTPVGRAYAEAYNLEPTKEFVVGLRKDAIESHKEIVNSSEWLSDTSKKNLCEKLDAITVKAVYPEIWEDYSGLGLEGLNYYDACRAIWLFDIKRNAALTNGTVDIRLWSDPSLTGATAQYGGITAYTVQNVIGEVCVNEGLTEICGQQARLAYAAKQDNFDYKAFFETRAKVGRCLRTPELEQQCIFGADKHPSAYIDVNGPAQMFEKFYEVYDVKEGDGMYLAPEARIALW